MADISDVLDALQSAALAAVLPGGVSITGRRIAVGQGWVVGPDLDAGLKVGTTFVSIYAVPSSTSKLAVPLSVGYDPVITPPVHGMAATATDNGFVLSGQPGVGEYLTVILGRTAYSYAALQGDTIQSVAAAVAAQVPTATAAGTSVSITSGLALTVRIGAPGMIGEVIDRQRQNVILGTWAPTPSDRAVIGSALKVAIGQNLTVDMPDTSRSIWIAQGENLIDRFQNELAWRRDLTVRCEWDTVDQYPGYEVTAVDVTLDAGIPASTII